MPVEAFCKQISSVALPSIKQDFTVLGKYLKKEHAGEKLWKYTAFGWDTLKKQKSMYYVILNSPYKLFKIWTLLSGLIWALQCV